MIGRTTMQCPAKINLFLEVTGRREDGYHTLATLFAKIGLFDGLEIESLPPGPVELLLEGAEGAPQVPAGPENLVYRAAEAYRRAFRVRCGVRLRLKKTIPVGAGLGGGSSDAAGVLLGMHRLFSARPGKPPSARKKAALRRLAAGLGADAPFFLEEAPFCEGRGIGERLQPLRVPKALPWLLLVYPGMPVATAGAYRALRLAPRSAVLTRLAQLDKLEKKLGGGRPLSEWAGLLFNRLEDAVLPAHLGVAQAKRILLQAGARAALMSGSGSSVFGFFASHEEGERARRRLQGYPWRVFLTCCLG